MEKKKMKKMSIVIQTSFGLAYFKSVVDLMFPHETQLPRGKGFLSNELLLRK